MKSLYEKELWALRPEATQAVAKLEQAGWDKDLAVATLESAIGVEALYELDNEDERASK